MERTEALLVNSPVLTNGYELVPCPFLKLHPTSPPTKFRNLNRPSGLRALRGLRSRTKN